VEAVSGSWNWLRLATAAVSAAGGDAQPESMMTAASDGRCSRPNPRNFDLRIVVVSLLNTAPRSGRPVF
jgi:hypothetical protein